MRGTRCSNSSSSVNRQAARIGSAAFLLPATVSSPDRGTPTWVTNFSLTTARVTTGMGRGWKIGIAVVVALAALLAINALVVDGKTESAEATVPGGRILALADGEMQVVEGGPRDCAP